MAQKSSRLADFLPYLMSVTTNAVSDMIASEYRARFGLKIPEWRVMAVLGDAGAQTQRSLLKESDPVIRAFLQAIEVPMFETMATVMLGDQLVGQALRLLDDLRVEHGRLDEPMSVGEFGGTVRVELNHTDQSVLPSGFQLGDNDSKIIACAFNLRNEGCDVTVVSKDLPMRLKAAALGMGSEEYRAELVVDGGTVRMKVYIDGKKVKDFGVSLGKQDWETRNGVKVISTLKEPLHTYTSTSLNIDTTVEEAYELKDIPWNTRLTPTGEFIHTASWAYSRIGRYNGSHGCTNMFEQDARWIYEKTIPGDVVVYTNTGGSSVQSWNGPGGLWNIPWDQWLKKSALNSTTGAVDTSDSTSGSGGQQASA